MLSRTQTRSAIWAAALTLFILILNDSHHALNAYDAYTKSTKLSEGSGTEFRSATPVGENLVAFVALGERSSIATVHHNVHAHFLGWDCIVFVHKDESIISPSDHLMKEIGSMCTIVRLPGLYWIHFLMTLTPELTRHYKYIAIVLDDLFAPVHGDTAVNMPKLLQRMEQFNLSSISPSIKGAIWPTTLPREPCLWHVHHIETFFQIFSQDLFICLHSFMHFSNSQGWCLDLCLDKQLCPSISNLAVDATMIAYHLGTSKSLSEFVPESALVGTNLSKSMYRPTASGDLRLCSQLNCSSKVPNSEPLKCYQQDIKLMKVAS